MSPRSKGLVISILAGASASLILVRGHHSGPWLHFFVYLVAILLSSGMKVAMPKSNGTMCVNFPFILLGIVELSPYQAIILAVCSVIAQCRIRVVRSFSTVQILFNVANVVITTALAWYAYEWLMHVRPEVAPALALSSSVYFVASTFPVALIIAWESNANPIRHWRQEFVWYFPFYLLGAVLAAATIYVDREVGWMTSLLLIPVVYIIYHIYRWQRETVRDRERHIVEVEALYLRTIEGLAMAIEAKDKETHQHLMRVRVYVTELGKVIGLEPSMMKALETASVLHDIGKLAVPEHIITKPGKLTREEFEKMKIHPAVGADILARVRFPYPVVPIVRSHHEAWDGSGYPDGLKGEDIPIGARILTAVDCLDALASDRPYRKAMPLDEAMAFVKRKAGQQFDPQIVAHLEQHYREFETKARHQINAMAPLDTEIVIERGQAPGAGFAPDPATTSPEHAGNKNPGRDSLRPALNLATPAQRELEPSLNGASRLPTCNTYVEILEVLAPLIPFDCLAVYVKCDESILMEFTGGPLADAFSAEPVPMDEGLSGWVAKNQRAIVNGNPTVEPNFARKSVTGTSTSFSADSSALSVPLCDAGDALIGVLTLYSMQSAAFSTEHLQLLKENQAKFASAIRRASKVAQPGGGSLLAGVPQVPAGQAATV